MTLDHARRLAAIVLQQLRPYCLTFEPVGQIANNEKYVARIEFECSPRMYPIIGKIDEFERSPDFVRLIRKNKLIIGNPRTSDTIVFEMTFGITRALQKIRWK